MRSDELGPNPLLQLKTTLHSELSVKVHLAFHLRPLDQEADARAFAHIHTQDVDVYCVSTDVLLKINLIGTKPSANANVLSGLSSHAFVLNE